MRTGSRLRSGREGAIRARCPPDDLPARAAAPQHDPFAGRRPDPGSGPRTLTKWVETKSRARPLPGIENGLRRRGALRPGATVAEERVEGELGLGWRGRRVSAVSRQRHHREVSDRALPRCRALRDAAPILARAVVAPWPSVQVALRRAVVEPHAARIARRREPAACRKSTTVPGSRSASHGRPPRTRRPARPTTRRGRRGGEDDSVGGLCAALPACFGVW